MDGPLPPGPCKGRSASDSESDELLKSTFSAAEDGAMMEGRMMPSPSSPTTEKKDNVQEEWREGEKVNRRHYKHKLA